MNKPKVGIALDFALRLPNFGEAYKKVKRQMFVGGFQNEDGELVQKAQVVEFQQNQQSEYDHEKTDDDNVNVDITELNKIEKSEEDLDVDSRNSWAEVSNNPKALEFYKNTKNPIIDKKFDTSFMKYFYNQEHRDRFLEDHLYELYGKGTVINKADVDVINLAQSKLFDIVLFDRIPFTRKIPSTLAFLGRAGIYVRSIEFVGNKKALSDLEEECVAVWDPGSNSDCIIAKPAKRGAPTKALVDFFIELETKTKENAKSETPAK